MRAFAFSLDALVALAIAATVTTAVAAAGLSSGGEERIASFATLGRDYLELKNGPAAMTPDQMAQISGVRVVEERPLEGEWVRADAIAVPDLLGCRNELDCFVKQGSTQESLFNKADAANAERQAVWVAR